jgi:hypothetical protein
MQNTTGRCKRIIQLNGNGDGNGDVSATTANGKDVDDNDGGIQGRQ